MNVPFLPSLLLREGGGVGFCRGMAMMQFITAPRHPAKKKGDLAGRSKRRKSFVMQDVTMPLHSLTAIPPWERTSVIWDALTRGGVLPCSSPILPVLLELILW
jgi:hypothetical protein